MTAPVRRRPPLALVSVAATWLLLAGCFQSNLTSVEAGAVAITAEAPSKTSFLLRFRERACDGAASPDAYRVHDADSMPLPVLAAHVFDGGAAVLLATEPQRDVNYRIAACHRGPDVGDGSGTKVVAP